MPLRKQISDLHKTHVKSVKENLNWLNTTLKNSKLDEVVKINGNAFLKIGKIYSFTYNPITKDRLPFFDSNPLVISLGSEKFTSNKVDLCMNLNYFPYDIKVYIINKIFKVYNRFISEQIRKYPFNASLQKEFVLSYEVLKKLFPNINLKFGIRNYLRLYRSNTISISYENFYRLPFLEKNSFVKKGVKEINLLYYKSLKK